MRTVLMADGVAADDPPRWTLERRDERGDGLPRGLRALRKAEAFCGKMWKDVERFCGEIRRVTRCHTCETCETCETVYLHFLQLSHPRPILAVKWRRKEIRPEDYLVSMNAVSNSVAHKQLGEQLAHTAYI